MEETDINELMNEFLNESGQMVIDLDSYKTKINYINKSDNKEPEYSTEGSSGFDIRANIENKTNITIKPHERKLINTGLFFEIPFGLEIQIRPRSGLALKNGITVLNTPGSLDSDYRGEVKIILINLGDEDFIVNHGDRIAQAIIAPVVGKKFVLFNKVDKLTETDRSSGGFGSTGVK